MSESVLELFPGSVPGSTAAYAGTGVVPYQHLKELVHNGEVIAPGGILPDQYQPASLDLRLGPIAFRVPASFLPGANSTVADKIEQFGKQQIDLSGGAVLEKGCVYIAPLMERLELKSRIWAYANPKSSTGRLDVFTRVITDHATAFDKIEPGYSGPLFAEIAPKTFSIVVRQGSRLSQIRLRRSGSSSSSLSAAALKRLQRDVGLINPLPGDGTDERVFKDNTIGVTLDLNGDPRTRLVGYRAKKHTDVIDVDKRAAYDPGDFWEQIFAKRDKGIILNPDDFYILATKEYVRVPPDHAAEMMAYDTLVGEFRVHYAGFFDPGFGYTKDGGFGSKAVLEVRSHDVPFVLEHEQTVGWLRYEKLAGKSDRLYGSELGSSYQHQGLALSKHFKPVPSFI